MDKVRFHPNPASPNEASPEAPARALVLRRTRSAINSTQLVVPQRDQPGVPPGRIGRPAGPNGAGKTRWFRALAGQLHPTAGEVTLDGAPLGGWGRLEVARRIDTCPRTCDPRFPLAAKKSSPRDAIPTWGRWGCSGATTARSSGARWSGPPRWPSPAARSTIFRAASASGCCSPRCWPRRAAPASGRADGRPGPASPSRRLRADQPTGPRGAWCDRDHPRPEPGRAVLRPAGAAARGADRRRGAAGPDHGRGRAQADL